MFYNTSDEHDPNTWTVGQSQKNLIWKYFQKHDDSFAFLGNLRQTLRVPSYHTKKKHFLIYLVGIYTLKDQDTPFPKRSQLIRLSFPVLI